MSVSDNFLKSLSEVDCWAFASGRQSLASRRKSLASGRQSLASGHRSLASGHRALASGHQALASGRRALASGIQALASGVEPWPPGIEPWPPGVDPWPPQSVSDNFFKICQRLIVDLFFPLSPHSLLSSPTLFFYWGSGVIDAGSMVSVNFKKIVRGWLLIFLKLGLRSCDGKWLLKKLSPFPPHLLLSSPRFVSLELPNSFRW